MSFTVSFNCFVTACPFKDSTAKDCVAAGMTMKATTVTGELQALRRLFKPNKGRNEKKSLNDL